MNNLKLPPVLFLWRLAMTMGRLSNDLIDDIVPLVLILNHAINGTPIRQTTQITIIDKQVDLQLTREVGIVIGGLLGIIAIRGIELQSTLATPR